MSGWGLHSMVQSHEVAPRTCFGAFKCLKSPSYLRTALLHLMCCLLSILSFLLCRLWLSLWHVQYYLHFKLQSIDHYNYIIFLAIYRLWSCMHFLIEDNGVCCLVGLFFWRRCHLYLSGDYWCLPTCSNMLKSHSNCLVSLY